MGDFYMGYRLVGIHTMVDQKPRRPHKKHRIHKKWLKRYGVIETPSRQIVIANGMIMAHPDMIDRIKHEIAAKYERN